MKNQGSCGSCVAFATMGMAEASLIKAGAKKDGLDLSEQWLINCRYSNYPLLLLYFCWICCHICDYDNEFKKQQR